MREFQTCAVVVAPDDDVANTRRTCGNYGKEYDIIRTVDTLEAIKVAYGVGKIVIVCSGLANGE